MFVEEEQRADCFTYCNPTFVLVDAEQRGDCLLIVFLLLCLCMRNRELIVLLILSTFVFLDEDQITGCFTYCIPTFMFVCEE